VVGAGGGGSLTAFLPVMVIVVILFLIYDRNEEGPVVLIFPVLLVEPES
jgi:hypothetical protein